MKQKIIIVGAFHETVELCELCGMDILGIIDNIKDNHYWGYPILGSDEEVEELFEKYKDIPLVISPDSLSVKKKLYDIYRNVGFSFATIISPRAYVSRSATIGEGSIIQSGVNVSSNVIIGRFCKLNYNVNIMHDVTVGDFSVLAANAVILGRSSIGSGVYIGANATVEHDSLINDDSKVQSATFFSDKK